MSENPPQIDPLPLEDGPYTPLTITVPDREVAFTQMQRHAMNCLALALLADARGELWKPVNPIPPTRGRHTPPSPLPGSTVYQVPIPRLEFYVGPQHILHPIHFYSDKTLLEVMADKAVLRTWGQDVHAHTLERMLGNGDAVPMRVRSRTPIWEYREDREQFGRLHPRAGAYHLELLEYLLNPHLARLKAIIS